MNLKQNKNLLFKGGFFDFHSIPKKFITWY